MASKTGPLEILGLLLTVIGLLVTDMAAGQEPGGVNLPPACKSVLDNAFLSFHTKYEALEKSYDKCEADKSSVERERMTLKKDLNDLKQLHTDAGSLAEARETLDRSLAEARGEIAQLTAERDKLKAEVDALKTENQNLSKESDASRVQAKPTPPLNTSRNESPSYDRTRRKNTEPPSEQKSPRPTEQQVELALAAARRSPAGLSPAIAMRLRTRLLTGDRVSTILTELGLSRFYHSYLCQDLSQVQCR